MILWSVRWWEYFKYENADNETILQMNMMMVSCIWGMEKWGDDETRRSWRDLMKNAYARPWYGSSDAAEQVRIDGEGYEEPLDAMKKMKRRCACFWRTKVI